MDSKDQARNLRAALKSRMGAKHWWGPGGEALNSKHVLGDRTGIFMRLQGLKIIISLKKITWNSKFKKTFKIIFPQIPHELSVRSI